VDSDTINGVRVVDLKTASGPGAVRARRGPALSLPALLFPNGDAPNANGPDEFCSSGPFALA